MGTGYIFLAPQTLIVLPGTWTGVFRAARDIKRYDGVRGLFQGHSATLLRIFPYAAIKFMAYDQVHDVRMFSEIIWHCIFQENVDLRSATSVLDAHACFRDKF